MPIVSNRLNRLNRPRIQTVVSLFHGNGLKDSSSGGYQLPITATCGAILIPNHWGNRLLFQIM